MDFSVSIEELSNRVVRGDSGFNEVIDVRSQTEFLRDHIVGASHFPLLDNEERVVVGTTYKDSRFSARRTGLLFALESFADLYKEQFIHRPHSWAPLIYCWRGGMRSRFVVTLLREVGWPAGQLQGGYAAYRRWVCSYLDQAIFSFRFVVIAGRTLSGKSKLLQAIAALGGQVLDLEKLACHRSSLLGGHPDQCQPTQKSFDSQVVYSLAGFDPHRVVFVESESKKMGSLYCSQGLIAAIRNSPYIFVEADETVRRSVAYADYYPHVMSHNQFYSDIIEQKLSRYVPRSLTKKLLSLLAEKKEDAFCDCVTLLLAHYYDPLYDHSLKKNYQTRSPLLTLRIGEQDWCALAKRIMSFCD